MTASRRKITLMLSIFLVCGGLWAQDDDSVISGTVIDLEGKPVQGVQITVRHMETGRTWSLLTGSEGLYLAPSLPLGSYIIEASAARFKKALTGIHLKTPREVTLDMMLRPEDPARERRISTSSRESPRKERADSPPSRVTRETANRSSSDYRLPPAAQFPPVDRRVGRSPVAESPVAVPEASSVESPPVDLQPSRSKPTESPGTEQAHSGGGEKSGFSVQVTSVRKQEKANEVQVMLRDLGYSAYVAETDVPGVGFYYRVRVGPLDTREEAAAVGVELQTRLPELLPDFWIISVDR
ncbi:MAG: carboxypeptidase regulatory-like domain-containing protein [Acidobacteriota bacterium]